ncbi:MAG TPA: peptidoglycan DD-metalloendopeptidase family protein [Thermoanaerobaculia bacterium]|nr:peptidoglycan DD-metalloendopeptidase family protein [Thermoanaerobaculia bacterium]
MKTKSPRVWIGAAVYSLTTMTQAGASPIDGIWETVLAGNTHMIALVERADGRLLGYTPYSPGSWVVGGQRIGSTVTVNLDARDPMLFSDPGTITGIRRGSRIAGTLTDGTGTTSVTLDEVHAPRTVTHWLMGPSIGADVLNRAIRVENNAGRFVTGGFVGLTDCSFLACGGRITSWTVAGTAHTILTDSSGVCPSTSALAGTWDAATLLVDGTYTTTASCPPPSPGGRFFGGKEGLTDTVDILDALGLLRDLGDRIEAESPAAADAFASTYLHDGKTKADWQAQLAAMYAAFDDLRVTIDAVRQIVTFADAETNPKAISSPRLEWHLSVTGVPVAGGTRTSVLDLTSTFDGEQQLYWIGREARRIVFKGNGYAAPFSIALPIQAGDATRIAYGVWPFGVHGGGHPEGHPGWDFEYVPGRMVLAAADGVVGEIEVDTTEFPGQFNIRLQNRPGYRTHYDHIGALGPGIAVDASVVAGQALGPAGDVGPFNATHFGLDRSTGSVCPLSYLTAPSLALFDFLWQTAAYEEELAEPFPCNPIAVTFPLTRVWTRISGSLPAVFELTRLDPHTTDYRYTLRNVLGAIVQSGAIVALQPSATPDSGTFDLRPDGSPIPTVFARYRIVSNDMQVAWGATRPADLSGASDYSTTAP